VTAIAVTVFAAHFWRASALGLYEDDYFAIAPNLGLPVADLGPLLLHFFRFWPQGRPLNHFLPAALASVGWAAGGLEGIYAIAALWFTANCLLVVAIVRRLLSSRAALVAGCLYALFPADSTRVMLTHAGHVQGSMTFLLVATWMWFRGRWWRVGSYPVALLSLLAYEPCFLPFLALPLLEASNARQTVRRWMSHTAGCGAALAAVAWVRVATEDSRMAMAVGSPGIMLYRAATSLFLGPATSGTMFVDGALTGGWHLDLVALTAAGLVLVSFLAAWQISSKEYSLVRPAVVEAWPQWLSRDGHGHPGLPWWWVGVVALSMWSLSYALSLADHYPPTHTLGRFTGTHTAAAWPAALAAGAVIQGLSSWRRLHPRVLRIVMALYLVLLVGYGQYLQRGYIRAWHRQQDFWRQVVNLVPEGGPGWTVIVSGAPIDGDPIIGSHSWSDLLVYRQIYASAYDAQGPNFAHLGVLGDLIQFRRTAEGIAWKPNFWGGDFELIDPARLALLKSDNGRLTRIDRIETPVGRLTSPAPSPASEASPSAACLPQLPRRPVARLLFPGNVPVR
jgi:hypothetical protein